jgi:hypothetical protein
MIPGDAKDNLAGLATATVEGKHVPLFFLVSGKTDRVERSQIGEVTGHLVSHSSRAVMTDETFEQYSDAWEFHRGFDSSMADRTQHAKERAARVNIKLYFIPSGMIDACQPLHRQI